MTIWKEENICAVASHLARGKKRTGRRSELPEQITMCNSTSEVNLTFMDKATILFCLQAWNLGIILYLKAVKVSDFVYLNSNNLVVSTCQMLLVKYSACCSWNFCWGSIKPSQARKSLKSIHVLGVKCSFIKFVAVNLWNRGITSLWGLVKIYD